jgi:hypothetical protein
MFLAIDWTANAEVALAVMVTGLAAILGLVSFLSYRRLHNPRALMIALGFAAFFAKGLYLVNAAYDSRGLQTWVLAVAAFDLLILLLLYFAIRNR